jgi:hypothetical protein
MDRLLVWPGAMPLDTDLLTTNKNALIGLGLLALDLLGSGTCVGGAACTPTAPASLGVLIGPGRIYSLQNIDGTPYGSLPADTTNQIVKQGIQFGNVTLATPAPTTTGQSINYLIEATYQDSDTTPVALPYYNASNPAQAFTTQNTKRQGLLVLQAKAGTAATTGSQTTPSADTGFVGLYVVTVAYGQTTVTSGNIATAAGAPLIGLTTTTAPAAGGAGALPATPAGYVTEMVGGQLRKIAYY